MPYQWPAETDFALWELDVLDRDCLFCGRRMHVCDHRYRHLHTLEGPVELVCKLNHCADRTCPGHATTKSPELEITIALPQVAIGWDVFCWIGHRRCSRHMAISLIQSELLDDYGIKLSEDAIEQYIRRYQVMLAARQQDAESLRRQYESESEHDNRGRSDHDNRWSVRDLMRGMSTGGLLSGSFRDTLLPKATRGTIVHQRRIQGTSRPSLPQRSMAA